MNTDRDPQTADPDITGGAAAWALIAATFAAAAIAAAAIAAVVVLTVAG